LSKTENDLLLLFFFIFNFYFFIFTKKKAGKKFMFPISKVTAPSSLVAVLRHSWPTSSSDKVQHCLDNEPEQEHL
ncbi:hypothetical protein LINPERHAP2_LOCUS32254, partial [Linum perenne]